MDQRPEKASGILSLNLNKNYKKQSNVMKFHNIITTTKSNNVGKFQLDQIVFFILMSKIGPTKHIFSLNRRVSKFSHIWINKTVFKFMESFVKVVFNNFQTSAKFQKWKMIKKTDFARISNKCWDLLFINRFVLFFLQLMVIGVSGNAYLNLYFTFNIIPIFWKWYFHFDKCNFQ